MTRYLPIRGLYCSPFAFSSCLSPSPINSTMEHLRQTFAQCQREGRPALVTYVTAGFPQLEETPDILLAMQAGGAGESLHFATQLRTLSQ
jgi:hypothetical protein